jgi:hypothetical protein
MIPPSYIKDAGTWKTCILLGKRGMKFLSKHAALKEENSRDTSLSLTKSKESLPDKRASSPANNDQDSD